MTFSFYANYFIYRYGKTKDAFGWPEETEEGVTQSSNIGGQAPNQVTTDQEQQPTSTTPLTKLEK